MKSLRKIPVYAILPAILIALLVMVCVRSRDASAAPTPHGPVAAGPNFLVVETFVKAHCIECHNATKQKGDVALHTFHDAASIIKDRKLWEDVLEKVSGGEMPPKKKAQPGKAEAEEFLKTIDGIFYLHDLTVPRDPGKVTIRRLNRAEYNNTIRDLVGVDFKPAEDFPSDEIGQGFDNIGDVLSISPVLMERYLAAAEAIMQRAIPLVPPPPITHYVNARYLEPAIRESAIPKGQNRPLTLNKSLFTHYTVSQEGEYSLSFIVYPDPDQKLPAKQGPKTPKIEGVRTSKKDDANTANADDLELEKPKKAEEKPDPAKVAILVDKKEIKTFAVTKADRKNSMTVQVPAKLLVGDHKLELSLVHTPKDDPQWILRVRNFALKGPPDTRPKSQLTLLACDSRLPKHEQTKQILQRFATRAYRRPVTTEELNHLVKLAEDTEAESKQYEAGMQMAMQAVLISPKFLFRVELDDRPDSAGPHPIDEYQLASRLSYFIWSSMPDDELMNLAAKKQLSANIEPQVRRMLADPKADALVDNFAMQWLQIRRLRSFQPDTSLFNRFDERLRSAMFKETSLFIGAVFREDRSILDLIDSDFTFLNEQLARFYHIADTNGNYMYQKPVGPKGKSISGNEFVRVHLIDHTRGGVLTEASVLCVTSNPTRTSPVKRGKFVLEQILGMPPPPPPPNVPLLKEVQTVSSGGTARISLRQRMEQHRADPACANCHEHMDGIGFAFENFDAIGDYRTGDGGMTIDPTGTLPDGASFKGVAELKAMLKERTTPFSRCLTKKMLTYATGRGVEYYDQASVNKIVAALKQNNYKFSTLVVEIAKSDPFRMRRGKEQIRE